MAANLSEEASLHKNIYSINQEPPVITSPTGNYSTPAGPMQSPPALNLSRSEENPSEQELTQNSSERHKRDVVGQGQSVLSTKSNMFPSPVNASSSSSSELIPHEHHMQAQCSPRHNAQSPPCFPQNLPPASEPKNSSHHISENNREAHQQSEHQQNTQKQQPSQVRQIILPQSHPESSPRPATVNTEQHNSSVASQPSPQRFSPQRASQSSLIQGSITQGAPPGTPQPVPLTSLPPSHPTPLLPSQPSPADGGDQRPSEPTSRPDTEGASISPQHTMVSPGPPTSIYKPQGFSPNSNQTQLMGSNMQGQRGLSHGQNAAVPPHSQGLVNGALGQYVVGNPNPHYNQANMNRPMSSSAHHPYHNQTINPLNNPASHPTYHQQAGNSYSYQMSGQQHPQALRNMYAPHQYQQQPYYTQSHSQTQSHNQTLSRGGYPPKEWQQSPYQPHQAIPPNAYLPVASARSNGQSKESSMSPLGSEGSTGTGLLSPGPISEAGPYSAGSEEGKCESREQTVAGSSGSPAKQTHAENSDQPESPKEILDLDSHNAAARHRSIHPFHQHHPPASASHLTSGFMYDPRALHPGMQQGGIPPPHLMSQGRRVGNGSPYPGQPYPDPGRYAAQRPHPHLMEALQRPQQLPYSPGQTRMAMYQQPRPGGHFQGMMIQQRGLAPERFIHPG